MAEIPILLLAAGGSRRMGRPKQLLPWGKTTLIENQISLLLATGSPVFVVLGSGAEHIRPLVDKFQVHTVVNWEWERGMGSSISTGVQALMDKDPGAEGVLIALVDQALVSLDHYQGMLDAFRPGEEVILASRSQNGVEGVPALFDAAYFPELADLDGSGGAKKIMAAHGRNVVHLECNEIAEDLDTPEDYLRLRDRV